MKVISLLSASLFSAGLAWGAEQTNAPAAPAAAAPATEAAPAEPPAVLRKPAYKPPRVGAPAVRVAGGSRGCTLEGVTLQTLVPDHPAQTLSSQPMLYWYQSKPAKARFVLSITAPGEAQSILQRVGDATRTDGVHGLNLQQAKNAAGEAVQLKPGIAYKWTVSLVPDEENRSKDSVASGVIQVVEGSPELKNKLAAAKSPTERACILAENGIWYDALALFLELSKKYPQDGALKSAAADMVASVGLKEAAEAVRK